MSLSPDRLLPADPATRRVARDLYEGVKDLPIISPHGHVDPTILQEDRAFTDPADLLIVPDHYVLRLLHGFGIPLEDLGRGDSSASPREIWRRFAPHVHKMAGTPVRYWLEDTLHSIFGLEDLPDADNADAQFDTIAAWISDPAHRPRALFDSFGIEVLATTDDPADPLTAHAALRDDASFSGRVLPTFRPDRYFEIATPAWKDALGALHAASGVDTGTAAGLIAALENRRAFFREMGATATDSGVLTAAASRLSSEELERIHAAGLAGEVTPLEAAAYRAHMLWEMARMASEDGLVMQLHPGVFRGHHQPSTERFGPDSGHDFPLETHYTEPLREVLNDFGTNPTFRLVLFTVDETAFNREIAPLASFYPSVFAGVPWWFLDSPDGIRRYREGVTDAAGFYKTSGFIDDTRAFLSIPTRHDVSRRTDAGWLAELVTTGRLGEEEAHLIARDLVDAIPREVFRL